MTTSWVETAASHFEVRERVPARQWVEEKLGDHVWTKQGEVLDSVTEHPRTAVKACHDVGKSFTAAEVCAWWLDVHAPGTAFIVTTAPTFAQVRAILWREIARAHKRGHLDGRVNQTEWHIGGEIVGFGRKPADWNPQAFSGIHAENVLVVLDEADGVPAAIWNEAEGMAANEKARILAIGNPNNPNSHFAKMCGEETWNTIRISAFDAPAFTGERIPAALRELLITKSWVEARALEWGTESPVYMSKVLAEFPDQSEDQLISVADVRRSIDRGNLPPEGPEAEADLVAVDVARFGTDKTVLMSRWGKVLKIEDVSAQQDTMVTAGKTRKVMYETKARLARVDADGIGGGVIDRLNELEIRTQPMHGSARPKDKRRFVNSRAEWWWHMRELLDKDELDLPDDDGLASELTTVKYFVDTKGRIGIESKKDMAARGLHSPDLADTAVYAMAPTRGTIEPEGEWAESEGQMSAHNI